MKTKKNITIKEALVKAQNLCANQEKCIADIRKKLYDWKVPAPEHDKLINLLLKDDFINENRYAQFFAKDKFKHNKWGKLKIEYALKQKNISIENIEIALHEISEEEYLELLKNELFKKVKTIKDKDEYIVKSKLVRFATSRGFENGKVFDMVSEITKKRNK